jgi:nitrogen fixation/metabolism regulation signal transduction histidine kinase
MTRRLLASFRHASGSLGRQILLVATAQAAILLLASLLILQATGIIRRDVESATTAFLEEQATASRIAAAVTRQLVAAAAAPHRADPALAAEFRAAGDEAHEQIRRYLFREIEAPHRLQLESLREQHQRMEVAAARALELVSRAEVEQAMEARDVMLAHGRALQDAMDTFLDMRAERLERSRARQAIVFRYLHIGVAAAAALLLFAVTLMARFLYRRLAMPLAELATAATRIGGGDLDARVASPAGAELGAVADAFNGMADRLSAARNSLRERNQELEDTLARLHDAQLELVQTEKMSAVGQMMAGLAHELNNPLASVLGYGELALDQVVNSTTIDGDELARDYLSPLVAEADRARRLVHDLLRFARKPDDGPTAVLLADPLQVAIRLRAYAFEQAGLELAPSPFPTCTCAPSGSDSSNPSSPSSTTPTTPCATPAGARSGSRCAPGTATWRSRSMTTGRAWTTRTGCSSRSTPPRPWARAPGWAWPWSAGS